MRWMLYGMLLLLALLCGCDTPPPLPPLADDAVILAFGDSLTHGTGASQEQSYPAILAKLTGRTVINAGIPGEISADGLARLPGVLENTRPALLILCHGGNDLLRRIETAQTAANLQAMIELARQAGVAVILVAVPKPDLSIEPPPFYAELAKRYKIPCEEEILPEILAKGGLKSDYIHPNAQGYRRLAEALAKLLQRSGALAKGVEKG